MLGAPCASRRLSGWDGNSSGVSVVHMLALLPMRLPLASGYVQPSTRPPRWFELIWTLTDLTCKENEALKEHEDKEIYIMAKKQQWRRCPKCKMVVEKTEGVCGKVYGGIGCAGNCGQWISDPNVVGLPTPGYDADQGGPSAVHVNNSSRAQPQTSPAPGSDNPSGGIDLPPWSRP
ncbi:hypothetical protein FRB90_005885 [Tulasnella sp. 427]|nr:hypothetical protein FRB90_005885 [Tulasnella sp. 427]